jgi:lipopolysaccharide O-acetyltransferase
MNREPDTRQERAEGGPIEETAAARARRRLGRAALDAYRQGTRARDKAFSLLVSSSFASYGARSVLQLPVRVTGERRIRIGNDVFIGAGCWLQIEGPKHGEVAMEIGDGTSIVGGCVISAASSVRIGRSVLMARNVYVADHMHAFESTEEPVLTQGITRVGPVEIGDGAWLGQNVVVGPGVRIGRGAVVGSNSVVLADVPDFTVVAGAPARVVRTFRPGGEGAEREEAGLR